MSSGMFVHLLFGEIVRLEIEVRVYKKLQKCDSHFTQKNRAKQQCQAAAFYARLTLLHCGNDSVCGECVVTSVPDISVLCHFGP